MGVLLAASNGGCCLGLGLGSSLRTMGKIAGPGRFVRLALLVAAGCGKSHIEELADEARRENQARAEQLEQEHQAQYKKEKAEREHIAEQSAHHPKPALPSKSSCQRLAKGTRDCNAGKACEQVDPSEMRACAAYMSANGLEENPF